MKKLICAKDVEAFKKTGETVFFIEENTIITPSAKDIARTAGIEFSAADKNCCSPDAQEDEISSDMIYNVLKTLLDNKIFHTETRKH